MNEIEKTKRYPRSVEPTRKEPFSGRAAENGKTARYAFETMETRLELRVHPSAKAGSKDAFLAIQLALGANLAQNAQPFASRDRAGGQPC